MEFMGLAIDKLSSSTFLTNTIETEKEARAVWYRDLYLTRKDSKFVTLYEWCLERGARTPTEEELEIFDEA